MRVYLAGGMRSGWQDEFAPGFPGLVFVDPRRNGGGSVEEYAAWDLHHVKHCDICFVYVERDNPGCIGLAVEAGYARGLGKTVILVLEEGHKHIPDRYLAFLRAVADVVFTDYADAVDYLYRFGEVTSD